METPAVTPIRFHGSPRLVEGMASLTPHQARTASLTLDLKLEGAVQPAAPLTLQTVPVSSSTTRLRFTLPESTPPGIYEGTIDIGGESLPFLVEVAPHPYLVISPRRLLLQVAPGSEVIVNNMTVVNSGNVAVEITKAHAFGLFDIEGAERAIGAALGNSAVKGQGRLNRLLEEAADNHGGLVRVNVREGLGMIEPGELRNLRVTLRFSDRLKPGHTYWGTWPLLNLRYYVQVYVAGANPAATSGAMTQEES